MPRGSGLTPFQKGNKLGKGRKKGVPNKFTKDRLETIERVLSIIEDDHLEDDITKLKPRERMQLYTDLLEYVKPKLQRVDITLEREEKTLTQLIVIPATDENIALNSDGKLMESLSIQNQITEQIKSEEKNEND